MLAREAEDTAVVGPEAVFGRGRRPAVHDELAEAKARAAERAADGILAAVTDEGAPGGRALGDALDARRSERRFAIPRLGACRLERRLDVGRRERELAAAVALVEAGDEAPARRDAQTQHENPPTHGDRHAG